MRLVLSGGFLCVFLMGAVSDAVENLPRCISDQGTIDRIINAQKANPKNPRKYDGYREALKDSAPLELVARLAYAETVGANCPDLNFKIAPPVVESIMNRVRIRKGDIKAVVFQRDQYSSSMNIYPESRYREFLCPQDLGLWKTVVSAAKTTLASSPERQSIAADAVHYYLYKHSDRLKVPKWASDESEWEVSEVLDSPEITPCIRFFRNPRWR